MHCSKLFLGEKEIQCIYWFAKIQIEAQSLNLPLGIIASGGFSRGSDVASAVAIGADLVGIAGHFLQVLFQGGEHDLNERADNIISELKRTMLMVGASNLQELACKPVIITGSTLEWLNRRGINK